MQGNYEAIDTYGYETVEGVAARSEIREELNGVS
jgi:hypothetical protein